MGGGRGWGGGGGLTLACPRAVVGYEASTAGLRLSRTHLTGVTPGPAHGRTAQGLGAHDPRQLSLAHLVAHRGEAGSGPVVFTTHTHNAQHTQHTQHTTHEGGGKKKTRSVCFPGQKCVNRKQSISRTAIGDTKPDKTMFRNR